ncbi:MAG: polysaccharide biosynthesis protein [Lachnospiraceae bacterium]|nr:polysaccharide biosynthesis protein [Lachnospiraceae bacterium]
MKYKLRWALIIYDLAVFLIAAFFMLVIYPGRDEPFVLTKQEAILHVSLGFLFVFIFRVLLNIYNRIWRYAGPEEYIRLIFAEIFAAAIFIPVKNMIPQHVTFARAFSMFALDLLGCIGIRQMYQWIYQKRLSGSFLEKILLFPLKKLLGAVDDENPSNELTKIKVAIIGAGSVGAMLAEELQRNVKASYEPVCFVDIDKGKTGRNMYNIPVISGDEELQKQLSSFDVQEVIFALPNISNERRTELYKLYKSFGYKIKTYDYTTFDAETIEGGKRQIKDFDVEDLLFRSVNQFLSDETKSWYKDKNVLITGGGGSIGSELARQIAKCEPARLVILDIYENGAYDIQQELKIRYGEKLNLRIEIANVCEYDKIDKIFKEHTPDIVLHAAAHKHVPLMERNVCEAVSNNVFGTLNVVEICEKYHVKRFIMVSTDKAVNPTNVMGATKRMCEMIVRSRDGEATSFSATRFGNVLGSNGSVIPLFKRQIASGGPVTVTDKRIIRYFMTIPEASQLVMTSGAMAKNGDLYVLDMGKPVKILELAENMVRLSGFEPYKDIDIIETGLRPGEKLYEELLIKTETLDKTDNDMIFIERDKPLGKEEIEKKLDVLREALKTQSNSTVKKALMEVIPEFHTPEEVNEKAIEAEEMRQAAGV